MRRPRRTAPARVALAAVALMALGGGVVAAPAPPAQAQTSDACARLVPSLAYDHVARLGLDDAWTLSRGEGVTVAVVDSGVQGSNPHFAGALAPGRVTAPGVVGGEYSDPEAHGTAVAGIIAARPVDGSAVVGVAPAARIMSVRHTGADGENRAVTDESARWLADGIRYAADAGAKIINVSASTARDEPHLASAVAHAVSRGALVVASAGNRNSGAADLPDGAPVYPAAYEGVLGVGAVDASGAHTGSSLAGAHVDVVAPAANVTTACGNADGVWPGEADSSWSTAYVAGVAALVAAAHPDETAAQWTHRITATALRVDPASRSDATGWGEVRPYEAMTFVDDGSAPGPPSPVHPPVVEPEVEPEAIRLDPPSDPLATAKAAVAWTLVGGIAVSAIALVVGRLGARRSVTRRGGR